MNQLRKLLCAVALTFALGVSCFGQSQGCDPGETHAGPPCSAAQTSTDDSINSDQTETPSAADSVDFVYVAEAALTALLIF